MKATTSGRGRRPILTAALTVATAAGVATGHGLYQVAAASRVPIAVAWLYPVITDGLALVAYAATRRLHDRGRRYAATIVVLAAGLSGLAQAVYLAGGLDTRAVAPAGLRFGVGAWPAIAAALTAHLLHLIGTEPTATEDMAAVTPPRQPTPGEDPSNPDGVQPFNAASVRPYNPTYTDAPYNPAYRASVQPRTPEQRSTSPVQPEPPATVYGASVGVNAPSRSSDIGRPRDRARAAGRDYRDRHGHLPTVTELVDVAQVARGTAAKALHDLRGERPALHIVNADHKDSTDQ